MSDFSAWKDYKITNSKLLNNYMLPLFSLMEFLSNSCLFAIFANTSELRTQKGSPEVAKTKLNHLLFLLFCDPFHHQNLLLPPRCFHVKNNYNMKLCDANLE